MGISASTFSPQTYGFRPWLVCRPLSNPLGNNDNWKGVAWHECARTSQQPRHTHAGGSVCRLIVYYNETVIGGCKALPRSFGVSLFYIPACEESEDRGEYKAVFCCMVSVFKKIILLGGLKKLKKISEKLFRKHRAEEGVMTV